jgi:hypothetical protein
LGWELVPTRAIAAEKNTIGRARQRGFEGGRALKKLTRRCAVGRQCPNAGVET